MNHKEMRKALKDAGHHVPRANVAVEAAYASAFNTDKIEAIPEKKPVNNKANIYTYVGSGDTPPHIVNFLGRQSFVRGIPMEVTDEMILRKIVNHPCFVAGAADPEAMHKSDQEYARLAASIRQRDREMDQAEARRNKT